MPDPALVVPGIVGAFVGAIGWLCVGLYIQRRQFIRQAKNAARAVYFEIDLNRLCVEVAREHGSYTSLSRTSFDRLLPDLAAWLSPEELHTIVRAFMGHAGYDQAATGDNQVPRELRLQALSGILDCQEEALQLLRGRVFSPKQALRLERQLRIPG
ncbi:MAG: hypothetical protein AUG06_06320 [Actinobacteria bacterium 13_1_20CM_2_65_11]|nr:MAG: hypothetical protein AUH40_04965 [Chloroflexi bacterium 13_1_40CM_65_17]OLD25864.1 MAG: hypothetical protein AUJ02_03965 [Chloroflexi bacterium 13_1_40CM_3_65_12]OLD50328.1 MAG: hypothetical protein AUI42_03850 [Actinobacteria bacterium 13_1_40CM_2_65_8]OLE79989.1 MAG: hypothetical protein AUG06_06320 [Actinobacteria bacterium 13_1_20CM_2_65_11]